MLILLFRQPEARAILTLILSVLTLLTSFYSIVLPVGIWYWVSASYITLALYFSIVLVIMRWFAKGGQYPAIQSLNLDGQVFLVTGAAGGIGKETCLELAKRGARVILFARASNITQAVDDVRKIARSSNHVSGYAIDLADLRSIKSCVNEFLSNENE